MWHGIKNYPNRIDGARRLMDRAQIFGLSHLDATRTIGSTSSHVGKKSDETERALKRLKSDQLAKTDSADWVKF